MSSELDETCRDILHDLTSGGKRYSQLQRDIDAGSYYTVKRHVKHLVEQGRGKIVRKKEGRKKYDEVQITPSGRRSLKP